MFKKYVLILLVSMVPVVELRGAIPIAVGIPSIVLILMETALRYQVRLGKLSNTHSLRHSKEE